MIIVFALVSRASLFARRSVIVPLIARATIVEQSLLAVHWNEYKIVLTLKTPRCHYSNESGLDGLKVQVFLTKNGTIGAMYTCRLNKTFYFLHFEHIMNMFLVSRRRAVIFLLQESWTCKAREVTRVIAPPRARCDFLACSQRFCPGIVSPGYKIHFPIWWYHHINLTVFPPFLFSYQSTSAKTRQALHWPVKG